MMSIQELSIEIERTTPDTSHGYSLVGWALYEDEVQASLFALTSFAAAKWLWENKGNHTRTIIPVYSDTWFYGAKEE